LPVPLRIIKEHGNEKGKIFNLLTLNEQNRKLKVVAALCKISINLSTHLFRHAFATNMLRGGANLFAVMRALGHKKPATTQIYQHLIQKDISDSMVKAFRKRK